MEEYVNIAGLNLQEVEIVSIDKNYGLTVDIEVDSNHQYVDANGFINHNSSIISDNISNGIEPVFSLEYNRTYIASKWPEGLTQENVKDLLNEISVGDTIAWQGNYMGEMYYYEPHNRGLCIIETVKDYGYSWLMENYPHEFGLNPTSSNPQEAFVPKFFPDYLVTTKDLSVQDHVTSQAVIQKHTNQSISKTVNLPNDYSFDDFKNLYLSAWKAGLIGITTYRSGTLESVLSEVVDKKDKDVPQEQQVIKKDIKLPDEFINGPMKVLKKEGKKFYINLSYLPDDTENRFPIALWIQTNSDGEIKAANVVVKHLSELLRKFDISEDLINIQLEKIKGNPAHMRVGKIVSMCLRHNLPLASIVTALDNLEDIFVTDLIFAVKKFLTDHIEDGTPVVGFTCVSCGSKDVVYQSGCSSCRSCGSTNCA